MDARIADRPSRYGVIGVGIMGSAFARNLAATGATVAVFDLDPERARLAAAHGCVAAATIGELLDHDPKIILCSLPSDLAFTTVTKEIATHSTNPERSPIVVETSTLALSTKEAGRRRLRSAGIDLLDCPVSGTGAQAGTRDLVVFASGDVASLNAAGDALDAIARDVRRVGPFGQGTKMKLLANLLVAVHTTAAAEMLSFAEAIGVDPTAALDAITAGSGSSRMLELRGRQMIEGDQEVTATIRTFRKDLGLITALADDAGRAIPLLACTAAIFERAGGEGWDERDVSALIDLYRTQASDPPPDRRATGSSGPIHG